jgi:hypothetical protein
MDPILRRIMLSEALIVRFGGFLPFGSSAICFAQKV